MTSKCSGALATCGKPVSICGCSNKSFEPDLWAPCQGCRFCRRSISEDCKQTPLPCGQLVDVCNACSGLRGVKQCSVENCTHLVCQDNTDKTNAFCACHSPFKGKDPMTPLRYTGSNNGDFITMCLKTGHNPTVDEVEKNFPGFGPRERNAILKRLNARKKFKAELTTYGNCSKCKGQFPLLKFPPPTRKQRKGKKPLQCIKCSAFLRPSIPLDRHTITCEYGKLLYQGGINMPPPRWCVYPSTINSSRQKQGHLDNSQARHNLLKIFQTAAESLKEYKLSRVSTEPAWTLRPALRKSFRNFFSFHFYMTRHSVEERKSFKDILTAIGLYTVSVKL